MTQERSTLLRLHRNWLLYYIDGDNREGNDTVVAFSIVAINIILILFALRVRKVAL